MKKGHGSQRHAYHPTAAHRRPPAPELPYVNPAGAGWVCSSCRRAELSSSPHPDPHANGDCTCACGLSGTGR